MTSPKLYGVYTASFPFLEVHQDKLRPVIVVSKSYGQYGVIAIIPISSKEGREAVDTTLEGWKSAGLLKASVARVHRITTMLQSDLIAELGQLTSKDEHVLRMSLQTFLNL